MNDACYAHDVAYARIVTCLIVLSTDMTYHIQEW